MFIILYLFSSSSVTFVYIIFCFVVYILQETSSMQLTVVSSGPQLLFNSFLFRFKSKNELF